MPTARSRTAAALTLGVAALVALAACADAPSAPSAAAALRPGDAPRLEVVNPSVYASVLTRTTPVADTIVTTFTATSGGGTFRVPGGLRVDVPSGEFRTPTVITVKTLPGVLVAYEFQPHGLTFKKALRMSQDLKGTTTAGKDVARFELGYFESLQDLDPARQRALIREFRKLTVDLHGQKIDFQVPHFSGWMVSTGRLDDNDAGF